MKRIILFAFLLATALTVSAQTTFSNVQAMSGWTPCTGCALGGSNANYTFKQDISSPSMSGHALLEGIRGGTPFSHVLAYKNLGSTTSATTQFVQEAYLLLDRPQNSNGFSIAGHQTLNGKNYRFSSQCSFNKGIWSVWNTKAGIWQATNVACNRPPANTWTHIVVETERTSDNREHFLTISVNGEKSFVNQYVYPESRSGNSIGMHLEVDGNATEAAYNGYWDKVSFTLPQGPPSSSPVPPSPPSPPDPGVSTPTYTLRGNSDSVTGSSSVTLDLVSTNYAGPVSFATSITSTSGAPLNLSASAPSIALTNGGTATTVLTITANAKAASHAPAIPWKSGGALVFGAVLLGAPLSVRRKRVLAVLLTALTISLAGVLMSCGGASSSSSTPTKAENIYTVSVTPTGSGTVTNPAPLLVRVTVR